VFEQQPIAWDGPPGKPGGHATKIGISFRFDRPHRCIAAGQGIPPRAGV
jgi:hypothetical protein